jgi:hypothetical protein
VTTNGCVELVEFTYGREMPVTTTRPSASKSPSADYDDDDDEASSDVPSVSLFQVPSLASASPTTTTQAPTANKLDYCLAMGFVCGMSNNQVYVCRNGVTMCLGNGVLNNNDACGQCLSTTSPAPSLPALGSPGFGPGLGPGLGPGFGPGYPAEAPGSSGSASLPASQGVVRFGLAATIVALCLAVVYLG